MIVARAMPSEAIASGQNVEDSCTYFCNDAAMIKARKTVVHIDCWFLLAVFHQGVRGLKKFEWIFRPAVLSHS